MNRVILLDADRLSLNRMRNLLEREGLSVKAYAQVDPALKDMSTENPDIVIVDIDIPRGGGYALLRRIRRNTSAAIIALNLGGDSEEEINCLNVGADDVIPKPVDERLWLARVNALLRRVSIAIGISGDESCQTPLLRRGALFMDMNRLSASWKGWPLALTKTEFRLLFFLAERMDIVRNRDQIQDVINGENVFAVDRNVDSHIKRLRQKIRHVDPEFDSIQTIYGVGYKFTSEEDSPALSVVQ